MNEGEISQMMRIAESMLAIELEIGVPAVMHCGSTIDWQYSHFLVNFRSAMDTRSTISQVLG